MSKHLGCVAMQVSGVAAPLHASDGDHEDLKCAVVWVGGFQAIVAAMRERSEAKRVSHRC